MDIAPVGVQMTYANANAASQVQQNLILRLNSSVAQLFGRHFFFDYPQRFADAPSDTMAVKAKATTFNAYKNCFG